MEEEEIEEWSSSSRKSNKGEKERKKKRRKKRRKGKRVRDENSDVAELVVGEVEVAKAAEARKGVARVELDPHINLN